MQSIKLIRDELGNLIGINRGGNFISTKRANSNVKVSVVINKSLEIARVKKEISLL